MNDGTDRTLFRSTTARRRFLVHVATAAVVISVAVFLLRREIAFLFDPVEARSFVADFGIFAPIVLIGLQAAQVVVAPIPGHVLAAVAGYLFGPWWGTLYNMIGIVIGSTVAFWIGRRYGRSYVERIVHPEALGRFDGIEDHRALTTLFVFFLIPGLPDDVLCFAGGLTRIPLWKLVFVAVVGRTPAFFLVNVFGGFLGSSDGRSASLVLALFLGVSAIGYLYRHRLVETLTGED